MRQKNNLTYLNATFSSSSEESTHTANAHTLISYEKCESHSEVCLVFTFFEVGPKAIPDKS